MEASSHSLLKADAKISLTLSAQLKLGGHGSTFLISIYESPGQKHSGLAVKEGQLKVNLGIALEDKDIVLSAYEY